MREKAWLALGLVFGAGLVLAVSWLISPEVHTFINSLKGEAGNAKASTSLVVGNDLDQNQDSTNASRETTPSKAPLALVSSEESKAGWLHPTPLVSDDSREAYGPRHHLSEQELMSLGITRLLGTFTQRFDEARYRTINVGRSAELLNGTLVPPGGEFSMNQTIKQRTPQNGYVEGIVIGAGGLLGLSYGGGVSITTAATWGAAFFAGLEPLEQRAHSIWIDRYTPGLEATVSWGSLDLRFRNDTKQHILITAKASDTAVTVSIWGSSEYDEIKARFGEKEIFAEFPVIQRSGPQCLEQQGQPGFRITVSRDFMRSGEVVKSQDFVTVYQPSPEVTCV